VELEEDARYLAAYDLRYNATEGATALVDGEVRNVLGLGVAIGARVRAGRDLRELRGSFSAPSFLWGGGDLTASAYHLREVVLRAVELPPTVGELVPVGIGIGPLDRPDAGGPRSELGFQAQQALHVAHPWELLYGYRFKRTTCPGRGIPPLTRDRRRRILRDPCDTPLIRVGGDFSLVPERTVDVAGIDLSALRDSRDTPLNPTRGSFLSLNVLAAPQLLASDFDFLKEVGQVSLIRHFGRSPFTWAHGYRVGLIQVFGKQRLPYDDLFKSGGANTIRGYDIDTVGPLGPRGEPLGGEAMVVINQELRYHHARTGVGGAVFYDAGNVFAKVRDVDFRLRHSIGVGARYDSPFGLLRIDVAFPLDRRGNDRAYQVNFGLGQAF
jgi:outer membrane protein assembly factor BamA